MFPCGMRSCRPRARRRMRPWALCAVRMLVSLWHSILPSACTPSYASVGALRRAYACVPAAFHVLVLLVHIVDSILLSFDMHVVSCGVCVCFSEPFHAFPMRCVLQSASLRRLQAFDLSHSARSRIHNQRMSRVLCVSCGTCLSRPQFCHALCLHALFCRFMQPSYFSMSFLDFVVSVGIALKHSK